MRDELERTKTRDFKKFGNSQIRKLIFSLNPEDIFTGEIDRTNRLGIYPVVTAAEQKDFYLLVFLLKCGGNIQAMNDDGGTVNKAAMDLENKIWERDWFILLKRIFNNDDTNPKDGDGNTKLMDIYMEIKKSTYFYFVLLHNVNIRADMG